MIRGDFFYLCRLSLGQSLRLEMSTLRPLFTWIATKSQIRDTSHKCGPKGTTARNSVGRRGPTGLLLDVRFGAYYGLRSVAARGPKGNQKQASAYKLLAITRTTARGP